MKRVARKMDFSEPRIIAEYGPGEGVHSREIARRMSPDSQLLLFELDPALSRDLRAPICATIRASMLSMATRRGLPEELERRGIPRCDYILSGIPFSILEIKKKRALLEKTYEALADGGSFIIYQVTNELRQHATLFDRAESEYFLQNIPPMFITVFHKVSRRNGHHASPSGRPRSLSDESSFGMTSGADPSRKGLDGRNVRARSPRFMARPRNARS